MEKIVEVQVQQIVEVPVEKVVERVVHRIALLFPPSKIAFVVSWNRFEQFDMRKSSLVSNICILTHLFPV